MPLSPGVSLDALPRDTDALSLPGTDLRGLGRLAALPSLDRLLGLRLIAPALRSDEDFAPRCRSPPAADLRDPSRERNRPRHQGHSLAAIDPAVLATLAPAHYRAALTGF